MSAFSRLAGRYSPTVWLLTIGRLLDQTTLWMAIPFMSIFISRAGASVTTTGLVMAMGPVAQLVGNLVGGQWSDRRGRRPVILTAMAMRVFVLLGFAFATQVWQFALLSFGNGLVNALYNPAYTAAIADATPPAERPDAFALSRVMSNLGVGLGPIFGSALGVEAKTLVFSMAAVSSAVVATAFFLRLKETRPVSAGAAGGPATVTGRLRQTFESWSTIFTDHALLLFIAAGMLSQVAYGQINSSLALHLKATMPDYEHVYGLIWTLNGILVVVLQLPVTAVFRRYSMAVASAAGCATFAVGYLLFGVAGSALTIHAATVVWTLGEITLAVPNTTYATDIAPPDLRGRYVGASALQQALGGIAAPILGTALLRLTGGTAVMFAAAGAVAVAGLLFQGAERERSRRLSGGIAA